MGEQNRKAIRMLRDADYTMAEICRETGLSRSQVSYLKKRCRALGLVKPADAYVVKYKHSDAHRCPTCGRMITTDKCIVCDVRGRFGRMSESTKLN